MLPPSGGPGLRPHGGAVRPALGSHQIPPQPFGVPPGSGSGPSHGVLLPGQPVARPAQGYANSPGASRSDMSYPRYESPYEDINIQPRFRLLYIGLGMLLVGVIVLLAIVIAAGAPGEPSART